MRPLVPFPLRSAALLACWLALNQSLHPAHWVLGAIIGLLLAPALAAMLQELVDCRLAAYEVRLEPEAVASNVVPFPAKRRDAVELER